MGWGGPTWDEAQRTFHWSSLCQHPWGWTRAGLREIKIRAQSTADLVFEEWRWHWPDLEVTFSAFPLVSKHMEVNNRWSITWSYAGRHRLQTTHESEEEIIWKGEQLGDCSERLSKTTKNTAASSVTCSWKFWFCGRRKRWADNKASQQLLGRKAIFCSFCLWLETRECKKKGVKLIMKWAGAKQANAKQKQILCDRSRLKWCDSWRRAFSVVYIVSGVTNEGFRVVECCSNGLLHVEEDRREEKEQRTPIKKTPHFI